MSELIGVAGGPYSVDVQPAQTIKDPDASIIYKRFAVIGPGLVGDEDWMETTVGGAAEMQARADRYNLIWHLAITSTVAGGL